MEADGESAARQAVVVALAKSVSSVPSLLEEARLQLDGWHSDQGFWKVLLDISFDQQLSLPQELLTAEERSQPALYDAKRTALRTAGMIRFKNSVDKFWRHRVHPTTPSGAVSDENKAVLRQKLLDVVDEPERGVAVQANITIARIARHDFPSKWPDLFDNAQRIIVAAHAQLEQLAPGGQLRAGQEEAARAQMLRLTRAVDIVQRTLKELETVRMLPGKMRLTELANKLLPTLQPMFAQYFGETFSTSGDISAWASGPLRHEQVRTSHLFLKALQRLVVADTGAIGSRMSGPRTDNAASDAVNLAQAFFRTLPQHMQSLRDIRVAYARALRAGQLASHDPVQTQRLVTGLTKHFLGFGKLLLALLNRQNSKAADWDGWKEVVWWYWGQVCEHANSSDEPSATVLDPTIPADTPSRFVIQGLLLFQLSLMRWQVDKKVPREMMQPDFAKAVIEVLVLRLMQLSKEDLAEWDADPEQWIVGEEQKQEQYELEIRTAAERALMSYAAAVTPRYTVGRSVWELFERSASLPSASLKDILQRDAIYAAIGRLRNELPAKQPGHVPDVDEEDDETFDLSTTLATRLLQEASVGPQAGPSWLIIRRRIAWLIWEWSEHVASQHRAATYTVLVQLLGDVPGVSDVAVRLEAARSLGALADAIEFDPEAFTPFLEPALTQLASLAASTDLQEVSSIKVCTKTLSVLIERLGPRIAQHVPALASLVPPLWLNPDPEFKAKPSILVFVTNLVKAVELLMGPDMDAMIEPLHGMVGQLVRSSLEPASALYLNEDALSLWSQVAHSAPKMTASLFALLDLLPQLLPQAEINPQASRIVEEYALLAPKELLHGSSVFGAFAAILSEPTSPIILSPLASIDLIVQSLRNADAGSSSLCATVLQDSQVFALILGSSLRVKESDTIASSFVSALARIVYTLDAEHCIVLLLASAPLLSIPADRIGSDIIAPLIRFWCSIFERMGVARKRRITVLALAALLRATAAAPNSTEEMAAGACSCLGEAAALWSEAIAEVREHSGDARSTLIDSLTSTDGLGAGPLETDEIDWLEDTAPGSARLRALAAADPIATVDVAAYISSALTSVQQRFPGLLEASFAKVDPLVVEILMKDLQSNVA